MLLIKDGSPEKALERAEELRQSVEKLKIKHAGQSLGPITISLGVSIFPINGANGEELISAADKALYSAKESGRNRIVIC